MSLVRSVYAPAVAQGKHLRPTTMVLKVTKWDAAKDGKLSRSSMTQRLAKEGFRATSYTFGPGSVFPDHSHGCDKKDAIISGRFMFRAEGEEVVLEPGDMLDVPKGLVHYAEVVSQEPCTFFDSSR